MNLLVLGGCGYLGSMLVPSLLEDGHKVTVVDAMLYADNTLATSCINPRFTMHRGDVRDPEALKPFVKKADAIIPLAALVGAPLCDRNPIDAELVNLRAPLALFGMLSPQQLVIMPTTESVYGSSEKICTEDTKSAPLSTYGKHKVIVEDALMQRRNSVSLRLATVFGMSPRMRLDLLVNDFTWRAMKDRAFVVFEGHYRRTCLHIRDALEAFRHALYTASMVNGIYNVGSINMTKIELCEAIRKQVPYFTYMEVEAEIWKDADQRDYVVSDAKIRTTGFTPRVTLEDGIAELLRGYATLRNARHSNMA